MITYSRVNHEKPTFHCFAVVAGNARWRKPLVCCIQVTRLTSCVYQSRFDMVMGILALLRVASDVDLVAVNDGLNGRRNARTVRD